MLTQIPQVSKQLHQGATQQQTFPVPPVTTNPPAGHWINQNQNRWVVDAPKQLHQGATVMATQPVPPVTTNPTLIPPCQQPEVVKRFEGATVMRTDPIPLPERDMKNQFRIYDINRSMDEVVKRFEGATVQPTFPVPPVSQPLNYSWNVNRYIDANVNADPRRLEGATVQDSVPLFRQLSQPTYIKYPVQPEVVKRLEGAGSQQTFPVPPVSQPLNYSYDVNRYIDWIVKRFEGATNQQTYIFPVSQPYITVKVQQPEVKKFLETLFPPGQQSYVFGVNQPIISTRQTQQPAAFNAYIHSTGTVVKNYYTGNYANRKRMARGLGW